MSTSSRSPQLRTTRPPAPGPRKKILVVDDDVDSARLVARALSRDYDVRVAFDGPSGIDAALSVPPDLLVTDMAMPGMNGVEMVSCIRATLGRRFPILFLTACRDRRDVVAAINTGARAFLAKPVQLDRFEETVRRALRNP